jgi:Sec-independent protein translocase protein TatA
MIFKRNGRPQLSSKFPGTGTVKEFREETLRMFSIADMAVAGAVALLLFGPDQLPKVARRAGQLVRDVQNTSHSFIREMERAADAVPDPQGVVEPAMAVFPAAPAYHAAPEPAPHELVAREAALEPSRSDATTDEATLEGHPLVNEHPMPPVPAAEHDAPSRAAPPGV